MTLQRMSCSARAAYRDHAVGPAAGARLEGREPVQVRALVQVRAQAQTLVTRQLEPGWRPPLQAHTVGGGRALASSAYPNIFSPPLAWAADASEWVPCE